MTQLRYPDSAVNFYLKLKETSYFNKDYVESKRLELERRSRPFEKGNSYITLIADSFSTILKILPDYKQYNIIKVYPYNKSMVAADITYQLSKTQEKYAKANIATQFESENIHLERLLRVLETSANPKEELLKLQEVQNVAGFVFAQTYAPIDSAFTDMIPPIDLGWHRNNCEDSNGMYTVDNLYMCQVWRATYIPDSKTVCRGVGHNPFMVNMTQNAINQERFIDRLHEKRIHPDYTYTFTFLDSDGSKVVPRGYYWQENVTLFGEHREVQKEGYENAKWVWWRRPDERKHRDCHSCWLEPDVQIELMTPSDFGKTFGPILPKGMAGLDFTSGAVASIDWYGKLKVELRTRKNDDNRFDGGVATNEIESTISFDWEPDMAIPIRVKEVFNAIQQFILANPPKEEEQKTE